MSTARDRLKQKTAVRGLLNSMKGMVTIRDSDMERIMREEIEKHLKATAKEIEERYTWEDGRKIPIPRGAIDTMFSLLTTYKEVGSMRITMKDGTEMELSLGQ